MSMLVLNRKNSKHLNSRLLQTLQVVRFRKEEQEVIWSQTENDQVTFPGSHTHGNNVKYL